MNWGQRLGLAAVLAMFVLGGCGSDDAFVGPPGGGGGGGDPGDPVVPAVESLLLLVDPPVLSSAAFDDVDGVTVTAIARDINNVIVVGAPISFSADSGALAVSNAVTNDLGRATARLTTGGNARNRVITVRASSGASEATVTINVSGTQLGITGPTSLESGEVETYTVFLRDANGRGLRDVTIEATSAAGNLISPASAVTSPTGIATFSVTANVGGADTLTFTGLGLTATQSVLVSQFGIAFLDPPDGTEVNLGTPVTIEVEVRENGTPLPGAEVEFSATRGVLSAITQTTDGAGQASVTLTASGANGAGPVVVSAAGPDGVTRRLNLEFVATNPTSITVHADPTTIPPNGTAAVSAVVRDPDGNPVKNQSVRFTLNDISGGQLSASTAVADTQGIARVNYIASSATSAQGGVTITAAFGDPAIDTDSVQLTVAQTAVFIVLGTDNRIVKNDTNATYEKTYSALLLDSAGNPPPAGTEVRLTLRSLEYQKGIAVLAPPPATDDWDWEDGYTITAVDPFFGTPNPTPPPVFGPYFGAPAFGCRTEDPLGTGDVNLANDYNGNGQIDPANVALAPSIVAVDENGVGAFTLRWPQSYAHWVLVRLTATVTVAGTESTRRLDFVLTMLAADAERNQAPPNIISPFGVAATCADPL